MNDLFVWYVGIDWGSEEHQACILGASRQVYKELRIKHSGEGLESLLTLLDRLSGGQPERVAVAIETPRGPVVEALLERGFTVFSINPKQLDRFRDRHSVAGAKDDRRDAFVLADSLYSDMKLYKRVQPDDDQIIELRMWSRTEDELKLERGRLDNRIREELVRYYPQLLEFSSGMEAAWVRELWEMAPTPEAGQHLKRRKVEALLRKYRIQRVEVDEVLKVLQQPPLQVQQGTKRAAQAHIKQLLKRVRLVEEQLKECAKQTQRVLTHLQNPPPPPDSAATADEHAPAQPAVEQRPTDAAILDSLPGVGRMVAATLLSEGGHPLTERDQDAMRALTGIAPVTMATGKRSGKKAQIIMRRACNKRLRNALYHWARASVPLDPWAKERYHALRARGHSHGRALRGLADRWLSVLFAMLRDLTLYDPHRRSQQGVANAAAAI